MKIVIRTNNFGYKLKFSESTTQVYEGGCVFCCMQAAIKWLMYHAHEPTTLMGDMDIMDDIDGLCDQHRYEHAVAVGVPDEDLESFVKPTSRSDFLDAW